MTRRTLAFILSVVACSLGGQSNGRAQVSVTQRTPFLEVHAVTVVTPVGVPVPTQTYASETLLVFSDGFTVRNTVLANIAQREPFVAHLQQGVSPGAFATLTQAIQSNQIGLQSGNCSVDPVATSSGGWARPQQAPPGDTFDDPGITTITWYGRHSRTISLKIGDAFGKECPQAVKSILLAIGTYEATAFPVPPP